MRPWRFVGRVAPTSVLIRPNFPVPSVLVPLRSQDPTSLQDRGDELLCNLAKQLPLSHKPQFHVGLFRPAPSFPEGVGTESDLFMGGLRMLLRVCVLIARRRGFWA